MFLHILFLHSDLFAAWAVWLLQKKSGGDRVLKWVLCVWIAEMTLHLGLQGFSSCSFCRHSALLGCVSSHYCFLHPNQWKNCDLYKSHAFITMLKLSVIAWKIQTGWYIWYSRHQVFQPWTPLFVSTAIPIMEGSEDFSGIPLGPFISHNHFFIIVVL